MYPNHDDCCSILAEILVGYRQMRALIEDLDPFNQFESSTAHSTFIMVFELTALSLSYEYKMVTPASIVTTK